jgi:hypothetical protein
MKNKEQEMKEIVKKIKAEYKEREPYIDNYNKFNNKLKKLNNIFTYTTNSDFKINDHEKRLLSMLYVYNGDNLTVNFSDSLQYIFVPKTLSRNLQRLLGKKDWSLIANTKEVAIEKLLLVVSNLTTSIIYDENKNDFKELSYQIIQTQVRKGNSNTILSSKAVSILVKLNIIEVEKDKNGIYKFSEGEKCRGFKLTDDYIYKPVVCYQLKEKEVIRNRFIALCLYLDTNCYNIIVQNLLTVYPKITLPSMEEVKERAEQLVIQKYKRRGKQLVHLRDRDRKKLNENKEYLFVEDHLRIYDFAVKSPKLPTVGGEESGNRVVDFLVRIPQWIRKMVKIDNEEIVECDFKCLHPNLIMSIYRGGMKYITHQKIADETGISVNEVKKEHLSFFNQHKNQMSKSVLFNYYMQKEPEMMDRLLRDKNIRPKYYKRTSMKLFKIEVELMTDLIKRLNSQGIYVIYVYDALYCKKSDEEKVRTVMNTVAKEMKIYTEV